MTGSAAVVGHDGGCLFHDRHPIGVGDFGHQHGSLHKMVDLGRAFQTTDLSRGDRIPDGQAAYQPSFFSLFPLFQAIGFQRGGLQAGLDGFRTRLHDVQVTIRAVFGPFHVHRLAVMLLNGASPPGKLQDFFIAKDKG